MERSVFYSRETPGDTTLEYYIVIQDIGGEYSRMKSYGVRIEKIGIYGGGGKTVETKQINNIFYRKRDIDEFMANISKNHVVPSALRDVVEDYIIAQLSGAKSA